MVDVPNLVDHLFRREAGRMVPYLVRIFGLSRLHLAEDVVQDTLVRALEMWPAHGVPDNPSAWFMRVARNRAIDIIRRDHQFHEFTPELAYLSKLQQDQNVESTVFESELEDDQLRMMFACCDPELSNDAQVALILKTLCGFSVSEIAHAFLASDDAIEKKLGRARKVLRSSGRLVEMTDAEIDQRLEAVQRAVYLLFNEGYHSSQSEQAVRDDLCFEAIRLALLLSEHPLGKTPESYALLALLCFDAARLPGRADEEGALLQLEMQDRSKWDQNLIGQGFWFLEQSSKATRLSEYHVEAGIASIHCAAPTYEETRWDRILEFYDLLFALKPSPIVALNRAIAVGKAAGPEDGLAALDAIADSGKLDHYPFYPAARGEFLLAAGRPMEAARRFEEALILARTPSEAAFFERKLEACSTVLPAV